MKFIISAILIVFFSFLGCLYFPWWIVAIVAFLVSIIIQQGHFVSFICGFISLFLLWGFLSFWISVQNDNILAHRVSLLIFKTDSPFLLIFATALIAAMVSGFAALTGSYIRKEQRAASF
jgi:hypothetical protein